MHKVAKTIEDAVALPLFHIADPTAHEIKRQGIQKLAYSARAFTMEQDFYKQRFVQPTRTRGRGPE